MVRSNANDYRQSSELDVVRIDRRADCPAAGPAPAEYQLAVHDGARHCRSARGWFPFHAGAGRAKRTLLFRRQCLAWLDCRDPWRHSRAVGLWILLPQEMVAVTRLQSPREKTESTPLRFFFGGKASMWTLILILVAIF